MADGTTAINVTQAPHVLTAISAVMRALSQDGIGKGRKNTQQNYTFRGIDDVYNALAGKLSAHHLVIIPRVMSREVVERSTKTGGTLFYVTVRMEFTFLSALDGTSLTVGPFDGEAMDSGDKATNKAMSAAYKYMAMQTFCIPTEGDNDADATTHEVEPRQEQDDTEARLKEYALEAKARIAKCDTPAELHNLWTRIERGDGIKLMEARLPKLAKELRAAMAQRQSEIGRTPVESDEVPF